MWIEPKPVKKNREAKRLPCFSLDENVTQRLYIAMIKASGEILVSFLFDLSKS